LGGKKEAYLDLLLGKKKERLKIGRKGAV